MAKRRIPASEAAKREAAAPLAIRQRMDRVVAARAAEMTRLTRAARRCASDPVRFARAQDKLWLAIGELARAQHLQRELDAIVRETAQELATIELVAKTRTLGALARFHAARRPQPKRGPGVANFDEARHAVAVVMADRRRMREELARLESDPAETKAAARWRRALVAHEAHLEVLLAGLRAVVAHEAHLEVLLAGLRAVVAAASK